MCGFHFEWQKTMVEMLRSYLLTDNLENPLEYAVPTLSQKRRETILCLQTVHPSLFIHTTRSSAVRFERD